MARRTTVFQTIRSEGGLLPADLLRRVLDPKEKLEGARSEDYGLLLGERLNEVITQSWNRLRKHWAEFRAAADKLPKDEPGTGLTNDKWSLPLLRELGFGLLPTSAGPVINGRTYAINRFFGPVPIHLVGCGLSLDRRAAGIRGAAAANPHGLVQEFLNRSSGHLWAIVSNGLCLRILRDNQALSRQSFLEFDLEDMFDGEVYSDFILLWLMAHATRFAPREGERPETCWLEQWTKLANEHGTRALGDLRGGVEKALQILGEGFTGHPKNTALRDALRTGQVPPTDFHGQLLRVVYRLIFLFVAEDRTLDGQPLLHPRDVSDAARVARERFAAYYGTAHLREQASKIKGSRHGDLWWQFQILVGALSGDAAFATAREYLALPELGSFLWYPVSTAALNDAELTNYDFLEALRRLAFTRQGNVLRPVDYRNLGAEELGGVYESLLALTPQISADGARFAFDEFAGNERKTSGSYYTPDSLVQCLLDSALDPVVEEAIKGKNGTEAEKAILALKVCDPAVGSGHFLVGAAHRLARHLARVRAVAQGESEPSPLLYQHALRDVIGRCLYGVDINPMAAELCRVSLWLEALEPGKPLSFLDHHIRVGNSLLGATSELIADGLPDDAFTAIEGDDKKVCAALKKQNKQERKGQRDMAHMMVAEPVAEYNSFAEQTHDINEAPDNTINEIERKAEQFRRLVVSLEYQHAQQVADAWCAAFVWKKQASAPFQPITTDTIRRLEIDPKALAPDQHSEVERLSREYRFFHWHLAFPEVFAKGGFDCVLGNPPWERTAFEDLQFFATRMPAILNAPTTSVRKQMITRLAQENPHLYFELLEARRSAEGETALVSFTNRYPLSASGRINTYALFTELSLQILGPSGRCGVIVQTGIATDAPMEEFWRHMVDTKRIDSIFDFENKEAIFTTIHRSMKFCLLTLKGVGSVGTDQIRCGFFLQRVSDIKNPTCTYELTADMLEVVNPNTKQPPVCRSQQDLDLVSRIHHTLPILMDRNSDQYRAKAWRALMSAGSSQHYRALEDLGVSEKDIRSPMRISTASGDFLALIESKQIHQFDPAFATYLNVSAEERREGNPRPTELSERMRLSLPMPRFWAKPDVVDEMFSAKEWQKPWCVAVRDVTNSTNERTAIMCILPRVGLIQPLNGILVHGVQEALWIVAAVNSFICDYVTRQKTPGSHLNVTIFSQLPVPGITGLGSLSESIIDHALELSYVIPELGFFAEELGYTGPPFRWDEERRFLLRCELDAAFFHLYLPADKSGDWLPAEGETAEDLARLKASFPTPRDAVAYIMETFPIVKHKDEEKWGEYRTRRIIIEIYDEIAKVIAENQAVKAFGQRPTARYQTRLDPPPGPPCDSQGNFIPMAQWDSANWPSHIHPPKEAVVTVPEEIPVAAFVAMSYPSTDADKAICAAALAVVEQSSGLSSMEHLDVLLLATHPDWCKTFLTKSSQAGFDKARKSAPSTLFVGQNQSIRWKECRDYLEKLSALTVVHGGQGQPIGTGTALASVKANLPQGVGGVVKCALKALDRIRELRKDLSSVLQAQRSILDTLEDQHQLYQLAA